MVLLLPQRVLGQLVIFLLRLDELVEFVPLLVDRVLRLDAILATLHLLRNVDEISCCGQIHSKSLLSD